VKVTCVENITVVKRAKDNAVFSRTVLDRLVKPVINMQEPTYNQQKCVEQGKRNRFSLHALCSGKSINNIRIEMALMFLITNFLK